MKKSSRKNITVNSESELAMVASALIEKHPDARIFAFFGQMGAGKTTFIKTLCQLMQVTDNVASPTFSLINEYHTAKGGRVFHFDFYRIKKFEEAFDLGYEDYFYSGDYCFVEWPELIEPLLPEDTVNVQITVNESDGSRLFSF
ncbi:MAG: tRNA (adenosine(37)-N6)-threonylcarbamoyltransferase complex ATPase subunit type 1 TsaE [Bacteroidales bacterium]|nr:tRNA (adenosine(37)-N6)-threonylcarbamoyltransferase complex ATPase subunit type 1 TsaE [Bacteroidales bacterium]